MSGFVYNNYELNEYPEYPFTHFAIIAIMMQEK